MSKIIILLFSIFIFTSVFATPTIVSGGAENDYESWLARLNDDRLMIIFDRNPDWQSGDLYVTFSDDDGQTWTSPEPIIAGNGDQATLSFVQYPDGILELFYASNETGNYKIYSATSSNALNWNIQGIVDLGWNFSTQYYDPTVILEADGSLTMSYIVAGNGAYITHKLADGEWDTNQTLVASGGFRARVMKHTNGNYLFAYHKNTGGQYDYDVFVKSSTDLIDWSEPVQITFNQNSHDPFPNQMSDNSYLIYYAKYEGSCYNLCRRKSFDAINWEEEEQITFDFTNNTQPHFFVEDDQIYLVWAHAVNYPDDHDVYFEKFEDGTLSDNLDISSNNNLHIFPNPCSEKVQINFNSKYTDNFNLIIYNLKGQKVLEKNNANFNANFNASSNFELDVSDFSSGIYFMKVHSESENYIQKIIKINN